MRKILLLEFLLTLSVSIAVAQVSNPSVVYVVAAPSGACVSNPPIQVVISTGVTYTCNNGTWAAIAGSSGITGLTGDVTGSGSGSVSTTVTGLGGVPFVNTPTPSLSDVICYDGVQYTPCPPTAGASQILYVTNTASDIATYDLWDTVPLGAQFTAAMTIPATTTKTLIQAFATTSGYPNATVIPSGEWQSDAYVQVSSAANTTTLNIDVYDRTSGGVETLLFSFGNSTVSGNGTAITHYTSEAVEPAFAIAATDRLVVKYNMTKTGGLSITGTLYGGGSSNYSHIHTPIGTIGNGGVTKTCSTAITAMTVTNGLITALTCP